MNLNQLKFKLDELVEAIKKFNYIKGVSYKINNTIEVELKISIKADPHIDSIEEIHNIINYYENYLQTNYDEDFKFDLIIWKP